MEFQEFATYASLARAGYPAKSQQVSGYTYMGDLVDTENIGASGRWYSNDQKVVISFAGTDDIKQDSKYYDNQGVEHYLS